MRADETVAVRQPPGRESRRAREARWAEGAVAGALMAAAVAASLFPIVWLALTSLKTPADAFAYPPVILFSPTLANYRDVLQQTPFVRYLVNSAVVSVGAAAIAVVAGAPAAYAFARFRFTGRRALQVLILLIRMMPPIAMVLPIYVLYRQFGLIDTRVGLVLAYSTFTLPLAVFLLMSFFADLPPEIEEAARIDGCSRLGTFVRVAVPLTLPGIGATLVLAFLYAWNEYLFPVVLAGRNAQTLPVTITSFITSRGILWGRIAAGGTLVLIPVVVFSLLSQRALVRGLTAGGVKG